MRSSRLRFYFLFFEVLFTWLFFFFSQVVSGKRGNRFPYEFQIQFYQSRPRPDSIHTQFFNVDHPQFTFTFSFPHTNVRSFKVLFKNRWRYPYGICVESVRVFGVPIYKVRECGYGLGLLGFILGE